MVCRRKPGHLTVALQKLLQKLNIGCRTDEEGFHVCLHPNGINMDEREPQLLLNCCEDNECFNPGDCF